jgi:acetyl-CoA carboxylase biotin carboxylase subunit
MFRRLLIANRGEIARRIIRACKGLGIESVAVYSDADRDAPFVREASSALCIGPARASHSYLDPEAIVQAALLAEAQAVHPGYGFLSENALFAQMVVQAGLLWVGPPPSVIRLMGEKSPAKAAMARAGLPLVPGSDGVVPDLATAREIALRIGYPVLLKAEAGGGGRGIRRAFHEGELEAAWNEARAEAQAAFGNGALLMERFLQHARHIEFQVLGDRWGQAVHLGERECSIQRRQQKLLEEAPSSILTPGERERTGRLVAQAAASVGYVGAGTMEFLRDSATGELYFLEMNTRIQVEHPVTEEVTGIDLVQAQLRVAAGERLWFRQEDVVIRGHAIELRINAEDPAQDFRPDPGPVESLDLPPTTLGAGRVRVDAAVEAGSSIPPHYDSMIAKLIAWAPDRASAITVAREAVDALVVGGRTTTAPVHRQILDSVAFREGRLQIGVIPS